MSISQGILEKLVELEANKNKPFVWTEAKVGCHGVAWAETHVIHFDDALRIWSKSYWGGDRYACDIVDLEISEEFKEWIQKFKMSSKEVLIAQLLAEERDVLKLRCERDGKDFDETEALIKKELTRNFKRLK